MATWFEVRIAAEDATEAAQGAQAVFDLVDRLESLLSRFRESSEISQITDLAAGEPLRLAAPVFDCLARARHWSLLTENAFSPLARRGLPAPHPDVWKLSRSTREFRAKEPGLAFDLGAIGKGFALDQAAEALRERDLPAFLLVAGGSSVLAGEPLPERPGWDVSAGGLSLCLTNASLSGSGFTVQGAHLVDPRTGLPVQPRFRTWAVTASAADSDALSTAAMILDDPQLAALLPRLPAVAIGVKAQETDPVQWFGAWPSGVFAAPEPEAQA